MPEQTEAKASQTEQSQIPLFDLPKRIAELDPTRVMEELRTVLGQYRIQGVDPSAILESQRKNVEALTDANKAAYAGLQSLAAHQGTVLREAIEQTSTALKEFAGAASSVTDLPAKQAELVSKAFETALENMRQMADMTVKSNTEVFQIIKDRSEENLEEIKKLAQKAKQ